MNDEFFILKLNDRAKPSLAFSLCKDNGTGIATETLTVTVSVEKQSTRGASGAHTG